MSGISIIRPNSTTRMTIGAQMPQSAGRWGSPSGWPDVWRHHRNASSNARITNARNRRRRRVRWRTRVTSARPARMSLESPSAAATLFVSVMWLPSSRT
jgi:hypothetical protein